jgi:hypothetical protein
MEDHKQAARELANLMKDLAMTPKANNDSVLAINQLNQMRAQNGGYPLDMYHATMDPIQVLNRDQETLLASKGFTRNFIPHNYPKHMYRRNMEARYGPQKNTATGMLLAEPFVETRLVKSETEEKTLLVTKVPKGCGPWFGSITEIDPIPEGPDEDAELTAARQEGQITELRQQLERALVMQKLKKEG